MQLSSFAAQLDLMEPSVLLIMPILEQLQKTHPAPTSGSLDSAASGVASQATILGRGAWNYIYESGLV
jgi:hypothetical protein